MYISSSGGSIPSNSADSAIEIVLIFVVIWDSLSIPTIPSISFPEPTVSGSFAILLQSNNVHKEFCHDFFLNTAILAYPSHDSSNSASISSTLTLLSVIKGNSVTVNRCPVTFILIFAIVLPPYGLNMFIFVPSDTVTCPGVILVYAPVVVSSQYIPLLINVLIT